MVGFSQKDSLESKQRFFFGVNGGLNSSKISSDTLNFISGKKYAVGLFWKYKLSENIYFKNSILYSVKGSTSSGKPSLKFENAYLDFNLIPQFRFFHDFFLQTGISYSGFLSSKVIYPSGLYPSGVNRLDNGWFKSEINAIAGIEIRLRKRGSVEFNYFIPTSKKNTTNFQLSVNILLNDEELNRQPSIVEKRQAKSKEQINQLKTGILLVRLKTSVNKINALLKMGDTSEANRVKRVQEIQNRKIIDAFKHYYSFCETRFFFNTKTKQVLNKEFDKIFLDENLLPDSTIVIDRSKQVFIAEFGAVEQDTLKYYSYTDYEPNGNWNLKRMDYYYGGPDLGVNALIIKDENLIQLTKPFPYKKRTPFNSEKKHPDRAVKKMNKKLNKYYKRSQ